MAEKLALVTGGAGFIGSALVRKLVDRYDRIMVVDNLATGKLENIADLLGEAITFHRIDIRDSESISNLLTGDTTVFHLACLGVRHSLHSPIENHEVNATATLNLLKIAEKAAVQKFVHVSSSEVYGTAMWAPMDENHPTFPMTVYGASKLAGERYARAFYETYGLKTVVLRPFNSYGPRSHHEGDSGEVIPKFLLRALAGQPLVVFGDGSQTRDFTFVEDTAEGIALAAESSQAIGRTINLGSGTETSIRDLGEQILDLVDPKSPSQLEFHEPRPADVLRLCADSKLARDLLGYSPGVKLEEGLRKLLFWYQKVGASPDELLEAEKIRNWA